MSEHGGVTSLAFETNDERANAGPWLVRIEAANGTSVSTGPWERDDAMAFGSAMTELDGVPGTVVVEPMLGPPDLDAARDFLSEHAAVAAPALVPEPRQPRHSGGEHDTAEITETDIPAQA